MFGFIIILIIIALIFLAIRMKTRILRMRSNVPFEGAVASPASIALGELIKVAGGIYLSLILVTTFLQISMPEKILFCEWTLDPLAALAIIIALLQPIIMTFYYKTKHKM